MEWLCLEGTSGHHLAQPPCSKQDQLGQVAQSHVQVYFEFLQGLRLHTNAGQPESVLDHPNIKRCFLLFKESFFYFHMCSLILSLNTAENWLHLSLFPHQVLIHFGKIPSEPTHLQTQQSQLSASP